MTQASVGPHLKERVYVLIDHLYAQPTRRRHLTRRSLPQSSNRRPCLTHQRGYDSGRGDRKEMEYIGGAAASEASMEVSEFSGRIARTPG